MTTPPESFFQRNHGPIPTIHADRYRLRIDGLVERPMTLTLADLRGRFLVHTVEVTLQCAGNRRAGMSAVRQTAGALQWQGDAVGSALWTGCDLAMVLRAAGVSEQARHVAFVGADEAVGRGPGVRFGGSIPLEKARAGGVLLAYSMAGVPLPVEHGFPVRAIVPGYIGARSVKWLTRVTLRRDPSDNPFQARDYQLFPPHVTRETAKDHLGVQLGELFVDSVITEAQEDHAAPGTIRLRGYALAGGERVVERVELTADGGGSWRAAGFLDDGPKPWRWRIWSAVLTLPAGEHEIAARAVDSAGNAQPEGAASIWNFAGYMNNSWHRVRVEVRARKADRRSRPATAPVDRLP